MRLNQATASLITAILLISLTSCGNDTPKANPDPTASSPTTQLPEPTEQEKKASAATTVLTRYLEVRDDSYRALQVDLKKFGNFASGDEFTSVQSDVIQFRGAGYSISGVFKHTLADADVRSDSAVITDCEDRTSAMILTADGDPVKFNINGISNKRPTPIPASFLRSYTLKYDPQGRWLVDHSNYVLTAKGARVKKC